jgi:hypothetical protein
LTGEIDRLRSRVNGERSFEADRGAALAYVCIP